MDGKTHRSRMENTQLIQNAEILEKELSWVKLLINDCLTQHFKHDNIVPKSPIVAPDFGDISAPYAQFIQKHQLNTTERIILGMALMPHIKASDLDFLFHKNELTDRPFTQFGGIQGKNHAGFLPTIATVLYILCGEDIPKRIATLRYFQADQFLFREHILVLGDIPPNEPMTSSALQISEEYLNYFITGQPFNPRYSSSFPASLITTQLEWEELVLDPLTLDEVTSISDWLKHQDLIMEEWKLGRFLKRGFRALFYGPPGTGKTLTATLLGKINQLDVYRVDLSQIVSKYIGETEKNLARIFDMAEGRDWILFFDEADALFGERTANRSSNDRHANQEIAYLLQRIEDFPGLIILATNLKGNIDEAFSRRFQAMIKFNIPDAQQRLQLWQNSLTEQLPLAEDVNLTQLAQDYELAGGSIINVIRFVALQLARRTEQTHIYQQDILEGIRREIRKNGSMISQG